MRNSCQRKQCNLGADQSLLEVAVLHERGQASKIVVCSYEQHIRLGAQLYSQIQATRSYANTPLAVNKGSKEKFTC